MDERERRRYTLDPLLVRRRFERAAAGYDEVSVLQDRVREELLERLGVVRLRPARVLDVGAATGKSSRALARLYRGASVLAIDVAEAMLSLAKRRRGWRRRFVLSCARAEALPLPDDSVDLLFCNLALAWCPDLDRALAEFARVLAPDGLLTFSTYGPDTLRELRGAWVEADGGAYAHVNAFIDMHDIGDALVRAGFEAPVLDVEPCTMTYRQPLQLMRELQALGAANANLGRARGLTGRATMEAVLAAYERHRRDGRVPASFEIVYGQAWSGRRPSGGAADGETRVPLASIGRRPV